MTDLEKLTAEELVDRLIAQKQFAWQSPILDEIRSKLERLEQCEAALRNIRQLAAKQIEPLKLRDHAGIFMEIEDAARAALDSGVDRTVPQRSVTDGTGEEGKA